MTLYDQDGRQYRRHQSGISAGHQQASTKVPKSSTATGILASGAQNTTTLGRAWTPIFRHLFSEDSLLKEKGGSTVKGQRSARNIWTCGPQSRSGPNSFRDPASQSRRIPTVHLSSWDIPPNCKYGGETLLPHISKPLADGVGDNDRSKGLPLLTLTTSDGDSVVSRKSWKKHQHNSKSMSPHRGKGAASPGVHYRYMAEGYTSGEKHNGATDPPGTVYRHGASDNLVSSSRLDEKKKPNNANTKVGANFTTKRDDPSGVGNISEKNKSNRLMALTAQDPNTNSAVAMTQDAPDAKHRHVSICSEPGPDVIEALRQRAKEKNLANTMYSPHKQILAASVDDVTDLLSGVSRDLLGTPPGEWPFSSFDVDRAFDPVSQIWQDRSNFLADHRNKRLPSRLRLARLNPDLLENGPHPLVLWNSSLPPLLRFRRAVKTIITLLRATTSSRRSQKRSEAKILSFTQFKDELLSTGHIYGEGLTFDPLTYKAHKESLLSNEAKAILSMELSQRTQEMRHTALVGLQQAVEAFGEFPINMQESLVRRGWYERFDAKRVIIRQGHTADNFYFILSGQALVTILQTDVKTGEPRAVTVASLGRGNSFGELALMHGAKRSATVTCKDDVELLAVGREDFVDIFMHVEKNKEPEHIRFLRHVDVLSSWPLDRLPWDDPKICLFTYFRRGVVMCRDSNRAEWIYIVKTGSCRVLKNLCLAMPNMPGLEKQQYAPLDAEHKLYMQPSLSRTLRSSADKDAADGVASSGGHDGTSGKGDKLLMTSGKTLPPIKHRTKEEVLEMLEEHRQTLDRIYKSKHEQPAAPNKQVSFKDKSSKDAKSETVFVNLQKLGPKETFGLEDVAFSMTEKCTSVSLVSDGAEAVLINKKFFLQHLTDEMRKRLRTTIQPYPSEHSLQQKLQDKSNWEAFKTMIINDHILYTKFVRDTLYL